MKQQPAMTGWPYWLGGLILGLANVAVVYLTGRPWGVAAAIVGISRETWLTLGIFVGAFAAAQAAGEARLRWPSRIKPVVGALGGGLLMGYGARLALGCNVSGAIGGLTCLSLHGWGYLLAMLLGALVGSVVLRRYLV